MQNDLFELTHDPIKHFVITAISSSSQKDLVSLKNLYLSLDDKELWDFATRNELESMIAHTLLAILPLSDLPTHWQQVHDKLNKRITSYLEELDVIGNEFSKHNISLVALKNGGIAKGLYPCPGCCPMGDIDILIDRKDFDLAHQILLRNGYQFKFRNPQEQTNLQVAQHAGGTEYWKILPNNETFWLELQWRAIAGRWINENQEPPTTELMSHSIPIANSPIRLLAPEDNLLQVCLHTAKHSYIRAPGFRLHLDVERIVNLQTINWEVFTNNVTELNVKTAVFFSLIIPKQLFDTPIPDSVITRFEPPRWKRKLITYWLREGGLFNPQEKKFSRFRYILFTLLLYDRPADLMKGIFPSEQQMKSQYNFHRNIYLPYYHARRIVDLLFRRLAT